MKKLLLTVLFFLPTATSAAIAYDTSTAGGTITATSPKTWTHTTSGDDRFLVVAVNQTGAGNITGVTYGGVSMTRASNEQAVTEAYVISMWYLKNPASGSNTVSVSFTAGSTNGASSSYTGVLGGYDTSANGLDGTSPITGTLTTVNQAWMVMVTTDDGSNPSAGTGTTLLVNFQGGTSLFDSGATLSAGSNSLNATFTGGAGNGGYVVLSMTPVAAAVPVINRILSWFKWF